MTKMELAMQWIILIEKTDKLALKKRLVANALGQGKLSVPGTTRYI